MRSLIEGLGRHGERTALAVDGKQLSYSDLLFRVRETSVRLEAMGVTGGSRVGILMPNSSSLVCSLLAGWLLGAVMVPLNARYRSHELRYVVPHADLDLLLTARTGPQHPNLEQRIVSAFPDLVDQVDPANLSLAAAPQLRSIIVFDAESASDSAFVPAASIPATEVSTSGANIAMFGHEDEGLLIYTSGTTAEPKGCVHSLSMFLRTASATGEAMGLTADDVVWDPLPLFHTGGLLPLLASLSCGATYVTSSHFNADHVLPMLEEQRITVAYVAFATLLTDLMDHPRFPETDLNSIRWILAIGPPTLLTRVQRSFPLATQVSCYGCTEVGGVVVYNAPDDEAETRSTSSGRPFSGIEISIVDPATGTSLPPGSSGEIHVRGESLLRRFHKTPTSAVDPAGWFHTGDLGHLNDQGSLVFEGRLKDVFKVGGENVAASEIETVLSKHPSVSLAQAVSVPHERLSETVVAFVELLPGLCATEDEIRAFCAKRMAGFKVPSQVRFVTEWPMSATKIQKHKLRTALLAESVERAGAL